MLIYQCLQFTLTHHGVSHIQTVELNLARTVSMLILHLLQFIYEMII